MKRAMIVAACLCAASASGQVIFQDDFEYPVGPSQLWSNVRGLWSLEFGASGWGYGAGEPSNSPPTYTCLPFVLADIEIELDIHSCDDGGIWLAADAAGQNGVLLVLARGDVYWHNFVNGNYVGQFGQVFGVWSVGQTVHVRARAVGDTFEAYINGAATPTSSHTAALPPGRVGLYDFRRPNHRFDNVVVRGVLAECPPIVSSQPFGVIACPTTQATVRARAAGNGPISYRWQIQTTGGGWADLSDGPYIEGGQLRYTVSASNTHDLGLAPNPDFVGPNTANFRCRFTNGCGQTLSDPAWVTICHVDLNCDGAVDFNDYLEFLNAYNVEDPVVDFNRDGVVDFNDYLEFLNLYNQGC